MSIRIYVAPEVAYPNDRSCRITVQVDLFTVAEIICMEDESATFMPYASELARSDEVAMPANLRGLPRYAWSVRALTETRMQPSRRWMRTFAPDIP